MSCLKEVNIIMDLSNSITVFQGAEIKNASLKRQIRKIDKKRRLIRNEIAFVEDKRSMNNDYQENDYCALGTDWYIYFTVEENNVIIESFQSASPSNASLHALEMISFFKALFLTYPEYNYRASLNKSSLRLYETALNHKIIEEIGRHSERYSMYLDCTFRITGLFITKYNSNKNLNLNPKKNQKI